MNLEPVSPAGNVIISELTTKIRGWLVRADGSREWAPTEKSALTCLDMWARLCVDPCTGMPKGQQWTMSQRAFNHRDILEFFTTVTQKAAP